MSGSLQYSDYSNTAICSSLDYLYDKENPNANLTSQIFRILRAL